MVLLLQRQALVPGLLEEGLQLERSLELHREALLLRGELEVFPALGV